MDFSIEHQDLRCKARVGQLKTDHGIVRTPVFMPVGTIGTVKTLSPQELRDCHVQIMLSNTYHLYLKPGLAVLKNAGGLHRFNKWSGPVLTDSGGFQIYSLDDLKKVSEEGVVFKSHWDGSRHLFTPENVVDTQRAIGSDIMMVLDYLTGNPADFETAQQTHLQTLRWAERARTHFLSTVPCYDYQQYQFGIVQGGVYPELRKASIRGLLDIGFEGYAIGGLAVGEDFQTRHEITRICTESLPAGSPRYLMGVGKPEDILDAIEAGVDMFDCVIPTRNARNGTVFTRNGRLALRNAGHRFDSAALDEDCQCYTCRHFSRAYIHHMFKVNEVLGLRLATIHNVYFYMALTRNARQAVADSRFIDFKKAFLEAYQSSKSD